MEKIGVGFSVLTDEGDPGLLLYQLGEREAAPVAAGNLAGKIARSGARTVITQTPRHTRHLKRVLVKPPMRGYRRGTLGDWRLEP